MLPDLKLRQVGTRHVASVVRDGRNEDVGELQEAHLRAYCASLPGSWQSYSANASGMSRGNRRIEVTTFSKGEAHRELAQAVQNEMRRLLSEDPALPEIEVHRLATQRVVKANPALLAAYRKDGEKL